MFARYFHQSLFYNHRQVEFPNPLFTAKSSPEIAGEACVEQEVRQSGMMTIE